MKAGIGSSICVPNTSELISTCIMCMAMQLSFIIVIIIIIIIIIAVIIKLPY